MKKLFEARGLTRKYGETTALDDLDVAIPAGSVVGLIGRNGCGKTTLIDHVLGLRLPTRGSCRTFGVETAELGPAQLARIGAVHQENRLLAWMSVEQHLRYVAAFHPQWDLERERMLLEELELGRDEAIRKLSPGNAQKLAVVLAVCSRPELLLLDEPVSAMDPIARERLLTFLLEMVRDDRTTVVVSSHVLRDVERIVDRVLCLERGRVCADAELDELLESYGEWVVTSTNGGLPGTFDEGFVLRQEGDAQRALLVVRDGEPRRAEFERRHDARIERRAVNLERIFPYLIGVEGS